MKATPVVTMALFNNWGKLFLLGVPIVFGNSIYRRVNSDSEEGYFTSLCTSAWEYFNFLSVVVGGAIMIDHLTLLDGSQAASLVSK